MTERTKKSKQGRSKGDRDAVPETAAEKLSRALIQWIKSLDNEPGWKEWRERRVARVLSFRDGIELPALEDFTFAPDIEKQHAIGIQYFGLKQAVILLKDCEYYFRRYPFRGLPVTRDAHIANICEMYFSRFYEFKERLKNYVDAVKVAVPTHTLNFGAFIRAFNKEFDRELRARHGVHHHERFSDLGIDNLYLTAMVIEDEIAPGFAYVYRGAYRSVTNEWVQRVRRRGAVLDQYMEALAQGTLDACVFLSAPKLGIEKKET